MIRLDASIVLAHSDKQQAGPTSKKTFRFHPLTAWCDNTDESLVIKLRPGRAGRTAAARGAFRLARSSGRAGKRGRLAKVGKQATAVRRGFPYLDKQGFTTMLSGWHQDGAALWYGRIL